MYFDNAATTKPFEELRERFLELIYGDYFNPSSLYTAAKNVRDAINASREGLAGLLGCQKDEVYFTSCATEANNLALKGAVKRPKCRIVISAAEHASVSAVAADLKNRGAELITIPVDSGGRADVDAVIKTVNENTALVSVIHTNNETGALNDINYIAARVKSKNPQVIFHSDGVQAFLKASPPSDDVDIYTVSSHKICGPKGAGALKISKRVNLNPLILGGGQERGMRSGTENSAAAALFYDTAELYKHKYDSKKILEMQNFVIETLKDSEGIKFYASEPKITGIVSLSVSGINAETLLHMLEKDGIYIGLGSACAANKSINPVLLAMGRSKEEIFGSIRISFGLYNNLDETKILCQKILEYTDKIRRRKIAQI